MILNFRYFTPFRHFPRLFDISRRYAWSVPIVTILGVIVTGLESVGIGLLIPLLGTLMPSNGEPLDLGPLRYVLDYAGQFDPDRRVVILAATIFVCVVLRTLTQSCNDLLVAWVDGKTSHDIRLALSERLLHVGHSFYLEEEEARLINIISSESWNSAQAIRTVYGALIDAVAAVFFAVVLLAMDWRLALCAIVGACLIRLIQGLPTRRLRGLGELSRSANQRLADRMLSLVYSMRVIRVFAQEAREQQRFATASETVRTRGMDIDFVGARLSPLLEIAHAALFIGILVGAYFQRIDLPSLIVFLLLLYRAQPHLRNLEDARTYLAHSDAGMRDVEWLLSPEGKPVRPSGPVPIEHLAGPIDFNDVTFAYSSAETGTPALRGVTFAFQPGRSTALIGHSGSGKTTIVNMLCRFIEPDSGSITIGGIDLRKLDAEQWQRRVTLAGQDLDLIDGTIADNISFGVPGASQESIEAAARLADADGFIQALPRGYRTRVGSRGISLSGGQRQRIGVARALLPDPDLLILDEATSEVDAISESAVVALIKEGRRGRTTIVISHRASTLASCDDAIVIEDGRVVETGRLAEIQGFRGSASD